MNSLFLKEKMQEIAIIRKKLKSLFIRFQCRTADTHEISLNLSILMTLR